MYVRTHPTVNYFFKLFISAEDDIVLDSAQEQLLDRLIYNWQILSHREFFSLLFSIKDIHERGWTECDQCGRRFIHHKETCPIYYLTEGCMKWDDCQCDEHECSNE